VLVRPRTVRNATAVSADGGDRGPRGGEGGEFSNERESTLYHQYEDGQKNAGPLHGKRAGVRKRTKTPRSPIHNGYAWTPGQLLQWRSADRDMRHGDGREDVLRARCIAK